MTLAEAKVGQDVKIVKIGLAGSVKRRMMDMGMLIGEKIKVVKVAPMGDPVEIMVKNYKLSLRKKEVKAIEVEAFNE